MYKSIITLLAAGFIVVPTMAQLVVEKSIEVKPNTKLDLKLDFADSIRLTPAKGNTLRLKAVVNINDNKDNDRYELVASSNGDLATVKANISGMESIGRTSKNGKRRYHHGDCFTMDIYYEIEVPQVAEIELFSISGDIQVSELKCPASIETVSGYIDVSIPAKFGAEVAVNTITGGVYTNFDINPKTDECKSGPATTKAQFLLNNGGNRIRLRTVSSDIYLRKI
jgi:hypothetical protein